MEQSGTDGVLQNTWQPKLETLFNDIDSDKHSFISKLDLSLIFRRQAGKTINEIKGAQGAP